VNRRGFLAMLGLGAAAAPALPRRVYSFLWSAPAAALPPFFGVDRSVNTLTWGSDLLRRVYSAEAIQELIERQQRAAQQRVLLVSPAEFAGIKKWCTENPL
jgi:hypothetical protein